MKNIKSLLSASVLFVSLAASAQFSQKALPYAYNALETYIDAQTMEIHHSKHHAAYVTNLNNAIKDTDLANKSIEEISVAIMQLVKLTRQF